MDSGEDMTREGSKGDVSGEARAFAPVGAAPTKVRPGPPRKGKKALLMTKRHGIFARRIIRVPRR